jgi:lysophospholipase L1-like esterase
MSMNKLHRIHVYVIACVLIIVITTGVFLIKRTGRIENKSPLVWKKEIRQFKKLDRKTVYPENSVIFIGSSSIRLWSSLSEDMYPIPVIRRGFGGAKIGDVIYWAPKLLYKHTFNKVVVFAGTNDITGHPEDSPPEIVVEKVLKLVSMIHEHNPDAIVYYISITPTPRRWHVWPNAKLSNELIAGYTAETDNFEFLDFTEMFLTPEGVPDSTFFVSDGLHLNEKGYAVWTQKIKAILLAE